MRLSTACLHRYAQASRALRQDSRALQGSDMTLAPQPDPKKGLIQDLIYYLTAEEDPGLYTKSFDRLATWVDNSLDQYKVASPGLPKARIVVKFAHLFSKLSLGIFCVLNCCLTNTLGAGDSRSSDASFTPSSSILFWSWWIGGRLARLHSS